MKNLMLAPANKTQTMSSLEISQLTGKLHKNVIVDIERILTEVGIEGAGFSAPCKMPSGQTAKVYNLPKRECDLVVSGYSAKYRLAIIDRWQELEKHDALPNFSNPAEAARAWADKHEALMLETDAHNETKVLLDHTENALESSQLQLDNSKQYFSIKRVAEYNKVHWQTYSWSKLKNTHCDIVKIFDANYGEVNAYHSSAWKLAYPEAELPQ